MDNASEIFKMIYGDDEIKSIYKKIDEIEEENERAWCHHNFNHVDNVKNLVVEILNQLNCHQEFIEEAKIAAIMHDVGALQGKDGHAYRSYEYTKEYFEKNNVQLKNNELILEAIKNHSDGFNSSNLIQQVLILADKLDLKHTRPTQNGLKIEGNRQFKNIEDINVNISEGAIKVNFFANEKLNKQELENYYFLKKVGNAIKSFAGNFNLNYEVYLNGKEWNEIL